MKRIKRGLVVIGAVVMIMGVFSGCGTRNGSSEVAVPMVIGPSTELTLEEQAQAISDTAKGLPDYYKQIVDLAEATPDLSRKAKKKVDKLTKKYSARIDELAGFDYSSMSEEELTKYNEEINEIVSAIREVSDLITLGV